MALNIISLQSEVQARANASLAGYTLTELIMLVRAAKALNIDRTNLDAELQVRLDAIDNQSDINDVLLAGVLAGDVELAIKALLDSTLDTAISSRAAPADVASAQSAINGHVTTKAGEITTSIEQEIVRTDAGSLYDLLASYITALPLARTQDVSASEAAVIGEVRRTSSGSLASIINGYVNAARDDVNQEINVERGVIVAAINAARDVLNANVDAEAISIRETVTTAQTDVNATTAAEGVSTRGAVTTAKTAVNEHTTSEGGTTRIAITDARDNVNANVTAEGGVTRQAVSDAETNISNSIGAESLSIRNTVNAARDVVNNNVDAEAQAIKDMLSAISDPYPVGALVKHVAQTIGAKPLLEANGDALVEAAHPQLYAMLNDSFAVVGSTPVQSTQQYFAVSLDGGRYLSYATPSNSRVKIRYQASTGTVISDFDNGLPYYQNMSEPHLSNDGTKGFVGYYNSNNAQVEYQHVLANGGLQGRVARSGLSFQPGNIIAAMSFDGTEQYLFWAQSGDIEMFRSLDGGATGSVTVHDVGVYVGGVIAAYCDEFANRVFVITDSTRLFRSVNGGDSFALVNLPFSVNAGDAISSDDLGQVVLIRSTAGDYWISRDLAVTFEPLEVGKYAYHYRDVVIQQVAYRRDNGQFYLMCYGTHVLNGNAGYFLMTTNDNTLTWEVVSEIIPEIPGRYQNKFFISTGASLMHVSSSGAVQRYDISIDRRLPVIHGHKVVGG